ncbi:MAG: universal stress protein [Candidatus Bathyarchaeota archaeon]|nr:universal stress protein [Candidatus Bathyarchaeota archaeon]
MAIKRILAATDGSKKSMEAVEKAAMIAEEMGSEVELFNVIEPVTLPAGMYPVGMSARAAITPTWVTDYYDEYKKEHQNTLEKSYKEIKNKHKDLQVSKKLVEGLAATKIVEEAKEGDFDLIVVGARGLGFFEELVLGSTSKLVVDKAETPVLVVK